MFNEKILCYPGEQGMASWRTPTGYCNYVTKEALQNRKTDNGGKLKKAKNRKGRK